MMVDTISSSRLHTTHKTYKNKLYTNTNTNITGLWEKISESFHVDNDRCSRYGSASIDIDTNKTQKTQKIEKHDTEIKDKDYILPKKIEKGVECIYRSCGQRETCDTCNSSVAISDEGFLVCMNPKCSIIYKDIVDQTAEWRYYGVDDNQNIDPTRCGLPVNPLLVESSFGCKILCDGISSYEMRKIRRYTEWQSSPHKEKTQYNEFQHITIIANNAGIPKIIIDEALRCHKKISEHQTFRGSNRDGIIAASVYVAFRIHDCPRTAKEIATIFNLDNTSATKGCKNAVCIINEIENDMHNSEKTSFCKTRPEAFIERYCTRLQINGELTKLCQFIALRIDKNNLIPENTPHSIAAGIIYFVSQICGLTISKKDVNKISETSEVTINKCYKKLEGIKELLIPKVILDKYSPKK
jgi:transcription initiation factor TFIIIB Brf1 subunit/transcription initiation factor TFIIB